MSNQRTPTLSFNPDPNDSLIVSPLNTPIKRDFCPHDFNNFLFHLILPRFFLVFLMVLYSPVPVDQFNRRFLFESCQTSTYIGNDIADELTREESRLRVRKVSRSCFAASLAGSSIQASLVTRTAHQLHRFRVLTSSSTPSASFRSSYWKLRVLPTCSNYREEGKKSWKSRFLRTFFLSYVSRHSSMQLILHLHTL